MATKPIFINNIKNLKKNVEKLEQNYEQDLKKLEKNILTKISKKFKISISDLEKCLNGIEQKNEVVNEEKKNILDSENSIDDDEQILKEIKLKNKKYYLDSKNKYIYKKVNNKLNHIGFMKDDDIIFN